jgi:hypothetical protein
MTVVSPKHVGPPALWQLTILLPTYILKVTIVSSGIPNDLSPQDAVQIVLDLIADTPPPFSVEGIFGELNQYEAPQHVLARAYIFAQIVCGRFILAESGVKFTNEYFGFDRHGNVIEQGFLDEEPYFLAAQDSIGHYHHAGASLTHFGSMAAEVYAINEMLHKGSQFENLETTPNIVFLDSPTQAGLAKANAQISQYVAKLKSSDRRRKAWWKFW